MNGTHILVTGGAGFIGSHLVAVLLARGQRVTVLDDLSTGRRDNIAPWLDREELTLVVGDVADPLEGQLTRALSRSGMIHGIVHLAGQTAVQRSLAAPLEDLRINLRGTLEVIHFAEAYGVHQVVFASSAATYGDVAALPAREADPTQPLSPYGIHKLASEHHLRVLAQRGALGATSLRFFNVYGPRQDPMSPYAGVIGTFIRRALRDEPLLIHGDGLQTRDFVYVGDVAEAIARALFVRGDGAALNVGSGTEITVLDLARAVIAAIDSRSPIHHGPGRAGEILRSRAAVEAIEARLDWAATTPLGQGLEATVQWMRESST